MFYVVSIGMILKGQLCYHNFVYSSSTTVKLLIVKKKDFLMTELDKLKTKLSTLLHLWKQRWIFSSITWSSVSYDLHK